MCRFLRVQNARKRAWGANLCMSVLVFWGGLVQVGANLDGLGAL